LSPGQGTVTSSARFRSEDLGAPRLAVPAEDRVRTGDGARHELTHAARPPELGTQSPS